MNVVANVFVILHLSLGSILFGVMTLFLKER